MSARWQMVGAVAQVSQLRGGVACPAAQPTTIDKGRMKDDPQGLARSSPSPVYTLTHTQKFEVSSDSNLVLRSPKLVYNFVVEEQQIPNSRTTRK